MNIIRVGIIEDEPDVRDGLATLIGDSKGFECSGVWSAMEEALEGIATPIPDVVLADIGLPGMSRIEGTRCLRDLHPGLQRSGADRVQR